MLRSQVDQLDKLLSDDNIELIPDFNRRLEVACLSDCSGTLSELMQVLCALGYVEPNAAGARSHTVLLKGRVACEISQTEMELDLCELLFDGALVSVCSTDQSNASRAVCDLFCRQNSMRQTARHCYQLLWPRNDARRIQLCHQT